MPDSLNVSRQADSPNGTLQVIRCGDGDMMVFIKSGDAEVGVGFCTPNGGGYHPKTLAALDNLAKAMKADNEDPESPSRYQIH